ncbi:MAG TPA: tRNA (adenosine(37)-N6)-threonylcarbamoyltransferase complex dimerization subunit type 1 TsaB [Rhodanobacteraceae bacterium]|nr:tRNA (adenosine(37)-N6)-threonylcarbamoyltransferase complex dimerization subunit type 1 TsaB [Rhodanobacteraceae bacterium]
MNILAIETATEACSVALFHGDALIDRSEMAPRRHAELVLPMAESLLAEAGITRGQLDAIAVGRGPGAFTGVRLAISVAQGLALALDVPVLPVSSLAALAMQAPDNGAAVLAAIDARRGEIYAGAFEKGTEGTRSELDSLRPLFEECVVSAEALALPKARAWNVIGSGWQVHGRAIREHLPGAPLWADGRRYPQARDVARLAAPAFAAGKGVPPEQALPVYLRDKVALTLVEQRSG